MKEKTYTLVEYNYSFTVCLTPMGLESEHIVTDTQITSSSDESPQTSAASGRIYGETAWAPR